MLTGVVSLPFFGYTQQDEPKRVAVLVVVREIPAAKEFVQLPATNLPIVVDEINKPKTYSAGTVFSAALKKPVSRPIVKETVAVKAKSETLAPVKRVVKSAPTSKMDMVKKASTPVIEKTNLPLVASTMVEQVVVKKKKVLVLPPAEVAKNNSSPVKTRNIFKSVPQASVTKDDKKVIDEFSNEVTMANDLDGSQVSDIARVNALNYMWIGFFLILAGLVLGLLFGKPAFLVSVAGVVFIVLGFMV